MLKFVKVPELHMLNIRNRKIKLYLDTKFKLKNSKFFRKFVGQKFVDKNNLRISPSSCGLCDRLRFEWDCPEGSFWWFETEINPKRTSRSSRSLKNCYFHKKYDDDKFTGVKILTIFD